MPHMPHYALIQLAETVQLRKLIILHIPCSTDVFLVHAPCSIFSQ